MTSQFTRTGRTVLDLDLPAPPAALLRMATLMGEPACDLDSLSALIAADMALASALLKTVNSALFKLSGRIQTVREAITYLGFREVGAITLQCGLRAAFAQSPELDLLWQRAGVRSELMGALGQSLGMDAWAAHSAGLFEECGKALLLRHAPVQYRALWALAPFDDHSLASREIDAFGASHDVLGAALCETWGLSASAVHCVRQHLEVQATLRLSGQDRHRAICALSAIAHRVMTCPDEIDACVDRLAPQLDLPPERIKAAIPPLPPRAGSTP